MSKQTKNNELADQTSEQLIEQANQQTIEGTKKKSKWWLFAVIAIVIVGIVATVLFLTKEKEVVYDPGTVENIPLEYFKQDYTEFDFNTSFNGASIDIWFDKLHGDVVHSIMPEAASADWYKLARKVKKNTVDSTTIYLNDNYEYLCIKSYNDTDKASPLKDLKIDFVQLASPDIGHLLEHGTTEASLLGVKLGMSSEEVVEVLGEYTNKSTFYDEYIEANRTTISYYTLFDGEPISINVILDEDRVFYIDVSFGNDPVG